MKTKILAITLIAAGFLIVNLSINSDFIGWVGHEKALAACQKTGSCNCTTGGPTWCRIAYADCWMDDGQGNCVQLCEGVSYPCSGTTIGLSCDTTNSNYCSKCPNVCAGGSNMCDNVPCDSAMGCAGTSCPADDSPCPSSTLCNGDGYGSSPPCDVVSSCGCQFDACECPSYYCSSVFCGDDGGGCCTGLQ